MTEPAGRGGPGTGSGTDDGDGRFRSWVGGHDAFRMRLLVELRSADGRIWGAPLSSNSSNSPRPLRPRYRPVAGHGCFRPRPAGARTEFRPATNRMADRFGPALYSGTSGGANTT